MEKFDCTKITESKSFGRSKTYANLLEYLVDCTINQNVPKETTIASEIFGKSGFDPSQSTMVRVYAYNLRKKLKTYYLNEGTEDAIKIEIPKGGYAVKFINTKDEKEATRTEFVIAGWVWGILCLFALSLIGNIFLAQRSQRQTLVNPNGLWSNLIESPLPSMVVLGDLFIFFERDSTLGLTRTIRDPDINSTEEFDQFRIAFPRKQIAVKSSTYTHLIQGSATWIKKLTEVFYSQEKNYTINTISRFNPKDLQDYDLLVIGMIKTLGIFKTYFQGSAFVFDNETNTLIYQADENTQKIVYEPHGDADSYHTDYGIMAKFPGPNNNTIYLFGGLWDTGTSQSLKNFADPNLLLQLESDMKDTFGEIPEYYEILFEVSGLDRMELSTKILHLYKIDDTSKVWDVGELP